MRECGEDLLVDLSEMLFNELAFFRLMQDLDDPQMKMSAPLHEAYSQQQQQERRVLKLAEYLFTWKSDSLNIGLAGEISMQWRMCWTGNWEASGKAD